MNVLAIAAQCADQARWYDADLHIRTDATLDIDLTLSPHVVGSEIVRRVWVAEIALSIPTGLLALDL